MCPFVQWEKKSPLQQFFYLWCRSRTRTSVSGLFTTVLWAPWFAATDTSRTTLVSASSWLHWDSQTSFWKSLVTLMALSLQFTTNEDGLICSYLIASCFHYEVWCNKRQSFLLIFISWYDFFPFFWVLSYLVVNYKICLSKGTDSSFLASLTFHTVSLHTLSNTICICETEA